MYSCEDDGSVSSEPLGCGESAACVTNDNGDRECECIEGYSGDPTDVCYNDDDCLHTLPSGRQIRMSVS